MVYLTRQVGTNQYTTQNGHYDTVVNRLGHYEDVIRKFNIDSINELEQLVEVAMAIKNKGKLTSSKYKLVLSSKEPEFKQVVILRKVKL